MAFTKEYVRYAHEVELGHLGGVSTLMNKVQRHFHVVVLKNLATQIIQNCFKCAKTG